MTATNPMATDYTWEQCEGSLTPYPTDVEPVAYPDSLRPIYISHVGRHGARYPASSASTMKVRKALMQADSLGTITALGRKLLTLCDRVAEASAGRWGALDSLGMAEHRAIASRMYTTYPEVFDEGTVNAISSYSPRAMMSMMCFVHQLDRLNNKLTYNTATGRPYSYLMRPFDTDEDYLEFRSDEIWKPAYDEYFEAVCPLSAITRVLGRDYPFGDTDRARDLAINEYYVVAGLQAMEMQPQMDVYFTKEEANTLWSCFNLRQYLQRTATTVSRVPADIATALVLDIIEKADAAVVDGINPAVADLRFGHAETVMPLVSLLRLPGCYYLTNYFDTVAAHWRDWQVVPMASNVQFIFFRSDRGNVYVRTELNEKPVTLIPGDTRIFVPWPEARRYMTDILPLQP